MDIAGKRNGSAVQEDIDREESSSSKLPPAKKSKQVKVPKPSGESGEQAEISDHVMAELDGAPVIEQSITPADERPDVSVPSDSIVDEVSKPEEPEKKLEEPQNDI